MKLFRERFPRTPSVLVDTGYFVADDRNTHGELRPDVVMKDDWVLKAHEQFPFDVLNVSSHDLRYISRSLSRQGVTSRNDARSSSNQFVSANTLSDARNATALRPFVIREMTSITDGKRKSLRVAFVGLTEIAPAAPPGFSFSDPADAAKRAVPEARKNADLVIALAKVSSGEAARIAREAPGIDVIICGNAQSLEDSFTPPVYAGQTLIVFTPYETRMLGELRVYRAPDGKFSTKQRFISLDEIIPDDAAAKQLVRSATAAELEAQSTSKKLLEDWLASSTRRASKPFDLNGGRGEAPAAYVGGAACSQCHRAQHALWSSSAHAHTVDRLLPQAGEFEAGCLDCHATGASSKLARDKQELVGFQNVQCEACHGPGSDHAMKPAKGYGRVSSLQTACGSCHNAQTSPGFDVQAAWSRMRH